MAEVTHTVHQDDREMYDPQKVFCSSCHTYHRRSWGGEKRIRSLLNFFRRATTRLHRPPGLEKGPKLLSEADVGIFRSSVLPDLVSSPATCTEDSQLLPIPGSRAINFWHAHLVMQASRLSPAHGLPLDSFNVVVQAKWISSMTARIVDGRLLIRVESWLGFNRNDGFWDRISPLPTCQHAQQSNVFKNGCEYLRDATQSRLMKQEIDRIGNDCPDNYQDEPSQSGLWSCRICPSEFRFACWDGPWGQTRESELALAAMPRIKLRKCPLLVRFTWWMDAGDCLSASSTTWSALTTPATFTPLLLLPVYMTSFECDGRSGIGRRFEQGQQRDLPTQNDRSEEVHEMKRSQLSKQIVRLKKPVRMLECGRRFVNKTRPGKIQKSQQDKSDFKSIARVDQDVKPSSENGPDECDFQEVLNGEEHRNLEVTGWTAL